MINKLLSLILVLCMLIGVLAGCGNDPEEILLPETTAGTGSSEDTQEGTTEPEEGPAEQIELNRDDITLIRVGETLNLYDGSISTAEITWTSLDESVATFADGVVTAVAAGETTVSAEYEGVKVSCKVYCNIKENPVPPETKPITTNPTTPPETNPSGGDVPSGTGSRDPVKAAPTQQSVDSAFFDDAVFVGDSISLKLSQYAASSGALGKAKFLVVGSYGVSNAINDHPDTKLTYQGVKYTDVEQALAATGAKKVFIMLGMNDIGLYGIDKTITNWATLLDLIHSTCPGVTIYIQSMTPVWTGGERGSLKNSNVDAYNAKLQTFAQSHNCKYIDVAPYMKDSTGGLATVFCSDSYVHLTNEGAQRWIAVLKAYTGY